MDLTNLTAQEKQNYSNFTVLPISKLVGAKWNYKKESKALSEKLKDNIKRNGIVENIQVRELKSGFYEVINGNHRLDVCKELGYKNLVVYNHKNISLAEAQRIAIETNETKFEIDEDLFKNLLGELTEEYDFDELQADLPLDISEYLDTSFGDGGESPDEEHYTKNVNVPLYDVKNDKPIVTSIYNLEKTNELIAKINACSCNNEVKEFLRYASYRHIVFNYELIADFYAHSEKDVQELMEASALVIIDFDKAIEQGFIRLTDDIINQYKKDRTNE